MSKKIVINGNNFSNMEEFYDEMERLLTKNLSWKPGRNLDAFNDLLRGGFGVHEYGEELIIDWIHADKSRKDFGYEATLRYMEAKLEKCHPLNRQYVKEQIEAAKNRKGQTLFNEIVEIIEDSDNTGHYCVLNIVD